MYKLVSILLDIVLLVATLAMTIVGGIMMFVPEALLFGFLLVFTGVPFFLIALLFLIEDIKELK